MLIIDMWETGLEFLGAILAILGSFVLTSKPRNEGEGEKNVLIGHMLFFTSNLAYLVFFTHRHEGSLYLQMIVFAALALTVIWRFKKELGRENLIFLLILYVSVVSLTGYYFLTETFHGEEFVTYYALFEATNSEWQWGGPTIVSFGSLLAVAGSFIFTRYKPGKKNTDIVPLAFAMYIAADTIFVYYGFINGMYWFASQSALFLVLSVRGIFYYSRMKPKLSPL